MSYKVIEGHTDPKDDAIQEQSDGNDGQGSGDVEIPPAVQAVRSHTESDGAIGIDPQIGQAISADDIASHDNVGDIESSGTSLGVTSDIHATAKPDTTLATDITPACSNKDGQLNDYKDTSDPPNQFTWDEIMDSYDDDDANEGRSLSRSQSAVDTVPKRPYYGSTMSEGDAANDNIFSTPSVPNDHMFGYMSGMNVEITETEAGLSTQRLPEALRHVMLHVVGSRPSEEVKFRRLKYRLEQEVGTLYPDTSFMPRATRSQKPQAIIRQHSRQRARSSTAADDLSRDQSLSSVTRPPDGIEEQSLIGDQQELEKSVSTGLSNVIQRKKGVLIVLCINDLMTSMSLSILAPFFPKEARQKGLSDALSGWVFGVFALVQCLASPIVGKVLPRVGAKFLSQAGQFFAGGCTILFGMLQFVSTEDNGRLFIIYCFMLRMFMALGCASSSTAAFAIAAQAFPDNPATVFGLLETAAGFGLMMGPALGGVLYEVGGFVAPFSAIGAVMIIFVPIGAYILPSDVREPVLNYEDNISVRDFLRVPAICIAALAAFIACLVWVMPDPTLEPHLSKFNLSPTIIGLIFLLMAACYAICSPVWGWVADNVSDSAPMMVVGFIFTGIGFLALGPSPIFPLPDDFAPLWLDIVALIIIGLSISLALVPTYDKILDASEKAGIPYTLSNCSTLAGLWNASYSFGEFVGPVLAGWMMGSVGFGWTMSVASGLCFLMALTMLTLYLYERKFGPTGVRTPSTNVSTTSIEHSDGERTPLLGSVSA